MILSMANSIYKCVFSDLDKTLLNKKSTLSMFTKETIEKLLASGVQFIPASGRAFNSLPKILHEVKGIEYAITSNGVCVNSFKTGETLSSRCIPPEKIDQLMDFIKGRKAAVEIFMGGQGYTSRKYYENTQYLGDDVEDRTEYVQATRKPVDDFDGFIEKHRDKIEAFDISSDAVTIRGMVREIKRTITGIYMTNSEDYLIEISNEYSGKDKGVMECCRILGIKPEETISFGDAVNDIEMLSVCGLGIAVANAKDECKKAAQVILELTHDQDAVAKKLREIFDI